MNSADQATGAKVLPFRPRADGKASALSQSRRADDGVRGMILFFTGVRYERHDEAKKIDETKKTSERSDYSRSRRKRG
jgi:hypothetical protein